MASPPLKSAALPPALPAWNPEKCIQCNQCSFVCPHATLRPYTLWTKQNRLPLLKTPRWLISRPARGKDKYKFAISVSPLDCMGCGACANICPAKSITMEDLDSQLDQQPVFDYCVDKVSVKDELVDQTVKGSQFTRAPAGVLRLLRRLRRNHLCAVWSRSCSAIT